MMAGDLALGEKKSSFSLAENIKRVLKEF